MTYLMFVDESYPESGSYSQISGYFITPDDYVRLKYEVISSHLDERRANSEIADLHNRPSYKFSDFCPKEQDEYKYHKMEWLLERVYEHAHLVFCIGQHGTMIDHHEDRFSILREVWGLFFLTFDRITKANIIIPVIDLGRDQSFLGEQYDLYAQQHYPAVSGKILLGEGNISIQNPENLLEPFFSDDKNSVGVQLADIVGGMRLMNRVLCPTLSDYKFNVKEIIRPFHSNNKTVCMFNEWVTLDSGRRNVFHDSMVYGIEYNP